MSIFDKLKNAAATAATPAAAAESKRDTFTFAALPESLAQLQALPEASLDKRRRCVCWHSAPMPQTKPPAPRC